MANKLITALCGAALLVLSCNALAQTAGWWYGDLTRILTDTRQDSQGETTYGQCAVRLDPLPSTVVPGCDNAFVSFSCSGGFNSKSEGAEKYSLAQLAYVSGRKAGIYINGLKKHNQAFCFGESIWVDTQ